MRDRSDAFVASMVTLAALVIAGLVMLVLTWRGVDNGATVAIQVPYLVSGGIGGLALMSFALGVSVIQHRRWVEAERRAELDRVVVAAAELLAVARRESGGPLR